MYKYEIEITEQMNTLMVTVTEAKLSLAIVEERDFIEWLLIQSLSANGRHAYKTHYKLTENGLERIPSRNWEPQATRMVNPYLNIDEHFSGLYFIGCVGFNPVTENYQYCVKIGKSNDIGSRMKQHSSSNPLLYHNYASLPMSKQNMNQAERNCHQYLDKLAMGMPCGSNEWWFVDKETYMELCRQFSNREIFKTISEGIE